MFVATAQPLDSLLLAGCSSRGAPTTRAAGETQNRVLASELVTLIRAGSRSVICHFSKVYCSPTVFGEIYLMLYQHPSSNLTEVLNDYTMMN